MVQVFANVLVIWLVSLSLPLPALKPFLILFKFLANNLHFMFLLVVEACKVPDVCLYFTINKHLTLFIVGGDSAR